MFGPDENGVIARLEISPARRAIAIAIFAGLGIVLLYTVFAAPPSLIWILILTVAGIASLVHAQRMMQATPVALELTQDALVDTTGRVLANIADIREVERGALSVKPSNGFSLILYHKQPRAWAPGLWWRVGRRVGVGGITNAGAGKFMAEQIAGLVASRPN